MKNQSIAALLLAALLPTAFTVSGAGAVEIAPRISDREIVERLTRLEDGQQAMREMIEQRFSAVDQRFSSLEKRMEERMDAQWQLTLVLIVAIFGLVGFVVWDRKTAFKPLEKRHRQVTEEVRRDLELDSLHGSRLTRTIDVLRELAAEDPRLARALRRFFLADGMPHGAPRQV